MSIKEGEEKGKETRKILQESWRKRQLEEESGCKETKTGKRTSEDQRGEEGTCEKKLETGEQK